MDEDGRHTLGQGEPQVLEMDPHGPGAQPCLLGGRDQVHRELLTLLQLVTQSDLTSIRSQNKTRTNRIGRAKD